MSGLLLIGCKEVAKAEISIPTAQCGMCANTITQALTDVDGVKKVKVDMETLKAIVAYNPESTSVQSLESAIASAGYQANGTNADTDVYNQLPKCCKLPEDR